MNHSNAKIAQHVSIEQVTYFQVQPMRSQVLKPFLKPSECVNPGDFRPDTFHLAAFLDGNIVGIASFEVENHPSLSAKMGFRLRGMAADPAIRKAGIGRALVSAGEHEILNRGGDLLWFNARKIAFPFYERLGFIHWGELFEIPQIGEHKVMY